MDKHDTSARVWGELAADNLSLEMAISNISWSPLSSESASFIRLYKYRITWKKSDWS